MSRVVFGNNILRGLQSLGKEGKLKKVAPDKWEVVLGAVGILNTAGEVYKDTKQSRMAVQGLCDADSTEKLLLNSKLFQERVSTGKLKAEEGHPVYTPGMSMTDYERRVRTILEANVCAIIKKVWVQDHVFNGNNIGLIMAQVTPHGIYGPACEKELNDPEVDVCWSGRYFSDLSNLGGRVARNIHTVVTWDKVTECGMPPASKYNSPSLESNMFILEERDIQASMSLESSHAVSELSLESSFNIIPISAIMQDIGAVKISAVEKTFDGWL